MRSNMAADYRYIVLVKLYHLLRLLSSFFPFPFPFTLYFSLLIVLLDSGPVPSTSATICSYATGFAWNTVWGQRYHGCRISRKNLREWELCKPDHCHFNALEGGGVAGDHITFVWCLLPVSPSPFPSLSFFALPPPPPPPCCMYATDHKLLLCFEAEKKGGDYSTLGYPRPGFISVSRTMRL